MTTTNPPNSAGKTTTYIPSSNPEHPMWSDPTYIVDIARLIAWIEQAVGGPMDGLGNDAFEDYCRLCSGVAYLIANKLTIQYLESQPDLPTEELSPFVILNEGSEELKGVCQKAGISEKTYWFLDQKWTKRCLILHTLTLHAERQSERKVEFKHELLDLFCGLLGGNFLVKDTDDGSDVTDAVS
jgi:hypothetical protein